MAIGKKQAPSVATGDITKMLIRNIETLIADTIIQQEPTYSSRCQAGV